MKTKKKNENFYESSTHMPVSLSSIYNINHKNVQKYGDEISNVKSKQSFVLSSNIQHENIPKQRPEISSLSAVIEYDEIPNDKENYNGNFSNETISFKCSLPLPLLCFTLDRIYMKMLRNYIISNLISNSF